MRYYGIKHATFKRTLLYHSVRLRRKLSCYTCLDSVKRSHRKSHYQFSFYPPLNHPNLDCSIPAGGYCTPFCMIVSDLVPRENSISFKHGLKKLLIQCTSARFFPNTFSFDHLEEILDNTDSKISSSFSQIYLHSLEFPNCPFIDYFDFKIADINSSYWAIEFRIFFSASYIEELNSIINTGHPKSLNSVKPYLQASKNTRRCKKHYSVTFTDSFSAKSNQLYENLCIKKWLFFHEVNKFFKTFLHSSSEIPPAIIIYKTNIDYKNKDTRFFWLSIGIEDTEGQFLEDYDKLFFRLSGTALSTGKKCNDIAYVVNIDKIELEPGYVTKDFQAVSACSYEFSTAVFNFKLLEALSSSAEESVAYYLQKLTRIKLARKNLKRLLKYRYQFEKSIDAYLLLANDHDILDYSASLISEAFHGKTFDSLGFQTDYRKLTKPPLEKTRLLEKRILSIRQEFDRKTEILQHLADYKNESKNSKFSWFSTIASVITLYFLIFPENTKPVAAFLNSLVKAFSTFIQTFRSII